MSRRIKKLKFNESLIDAIIYINLNRSIDRRKNMETLLMDECFNGIPKYRFEAIDGKTQQSYIRSSFKDIEVNDDIPDNSIKIYAGLLSHLKTIHYISKSKFDNVLIFEDDVSLEFKKYWMTSLNECIKHAPKDWDILQLCCLTDNFFNKLYTKSTKNNVIYFSTAYLINRHAAKKLISSIYKNNLYNVNNLFPEKDKFDRLNSPLAEINIFLRLNTYSFKYPFFTFTNKDSILFSNKLLVDRQKMKNKFEKKLKEVYLTFNGK